MQGDLLFPVYLFNCKDNSFCLSFRFFFFGLFIILYQYDFSHSICSHRAGSAHNALSLWLSLVSPLVKFFGFDRCCWSALHVPLGLGLCLGRSLSVWEGYIHWLAPAGATLLVTWSGAVTRWRPAGASVPAV